MILSDYNQFGGVHGEAAAIRHLLAYHKIHNPTTKSAFSEALCFGLAGGIGAGYSFCPSMIRHNVSSGSSVVGRHKAYACDAAWYQGVFDRLGVDMTMTETAAKGKAYKNLVDSVTQGKPTIVYCSRARLPFLGELSANCDYWMHSLVVFGIDEAESVAHLADCPKQALTLSLDQLAEARNGICSHKNRTLSISPTSVSVKRLTASVRDAIEATARGMLQSKIKTFGLPGWQNWAKMITNKTNKEGWLKVYPGGWLYRALRDVYASIETLGTGGGLLRGLYADFLDEAGVILKSKTVGNLADVYRGLQQQWASLADAMLPSKVKPFKQTKDLLQKRWQLFLDKGDKGLPKIQATCDKLQGIDREMQEKFPLDATQSESLMQTLQEQILDLHRAETDAIVQLEEAVRGKRKASA